MKRVVRINWIDKVVFPVIVCLLFCACTEQQAFSPEGLIRLGARTDSYAGTPTRASVNNLQGLSAVGDRVGVFGVVTERADALNTPLTTEWNSTPLMNNICTTKIDAVTGALSWNDTYSYPLEKEKSVKFCVYHPYAATNADGFNYVETTAGKSPILHFRLSGAEDVMWVAPVVGSRRQAPGTLVFDHKLTQLRFRLVDDEGNFAGTRITGLIFTGVNTVSTLNIETGILGEWSSLLDVVAFPLKAPVEVKGTVEAPQILSGEVMLEPGQTSFRLTVKTDVKGDYPNVEIRPSGGETVFAAGCSYMVTLKFRERLVVALSAIVTPWVMDGYGEGIVE